MGDFTIGAASSNAFNKVQDSKDARIAWASTPYVFVTLRKGAMPNVETKYAGMRLSRGRLRQIGTTSLHARSRVFHGDEQVVRAFSKNAKSVIEINPRVSRRANKGESRWAIKSSNASLAITLRNFYKAWLKSKHRNRRTGSTANEAYGKQQAAISQQNVDSNQGNTGDQRGVAVDTTRDREAIKLHYPKDFERRIDIAISAARNLIRESIQQYFKDTDKDTLIQDLQSYMKILGHEIIALAQDDKPLSKRYFTSAMRYIAKSMDKVTSLADAAEDLLTTGNITLKQLNYRIDQQTNATRALGENVVRLLIIDSAEELSTVVWERRVITANESCGDCIDLASLGWVEVGLLASIGSTECNGSCKCYFEYTDKKPAGYE